MEKETSLQELEATVQQDQQSLSSQIEGIAISGEEDLNRAANWLTQVKARIKKLEEKRNLYVRPLNDQVKVINADFKTMSLPYLTIEASLKGKIGAYMDEQRRLREEEERKERERRAEEARKLAEQENISRQKAAAEIRKQEEEKAKLQPAAPKQVTSVKTENAKIVTKTVVKFEVVDPSKVPDEFKVVDERLVRQAVNSGAKRIAGVRIWEESQVSAF